MLRSSKSKLFSVALLSSIGLTLHGCKPRSYNSVSSQNSNDETVNINWKSTVTAKFQQQKALHAAAAQKVGNGNVCVTNRDLVNGHYAYQAGEDGNRWIFGDEPESEDLSYRVKFQKRAPFYRLLTKEKMTGYLNGKTKVLDFGFVLGWTMAKFDYKPSSSTTDSERRISQIPANVAVDGAPAVSNPKYWFETDGAGRLSSIEESAKNGLNFERLLVPATREIYVYDSSNKYPEGNISTTEQNPFLYELTAVFVAVEPNSLDCK
jgi:hypothetical protein